MQPRVLDHVPWYAEAAELVKAHQEHLARHESSTKAAADAPFLEELGPVLAELKSKSEEGHLALMEYVYSAHPPKKPAHKRETVVDDEPVSMKIQLKKALIHYHQDKNKDHGRLWEVLVGELYKYLAAAYETYK
jgi:hypothetical protein